jgi:hypothetical protein
MAGGIGQQPSGHHGGGDPEQSVGRRDERPGAERPQHVGLLGVRVQLPGDDLDGNEDRGQRRDHAEDAECDGLGPDRPLGLGLYDRGDIGVGPTDTGVGCGQPCVLPSHGGVVPGPPDELDTRVDALQAGRPERPDEVGSAEEEPGPVLVDVVLDDLVVEDDHADHREVEPPDQREQVGRVGRVEADRDVRSDVQVQQRGCY